MKKLAFAASVLALFAGAAQAETIGVSITNFDDNFQTLLRNGIAAHAESLGVDVQIEDAHKDVAKQLDQINNFIANGVDGIIVTLTDTSAADALTQAASAANIPLVFLNLEPSNVDSLPDNQAFVGSNEIESGTLGAFEACKMLRAAGKSDGANGYILIGDLAHSAAIQRTADVEQILATDMCKFISITDKQAGGWSRENAQNLMTNWLSTGTVPDVVFANNDEMAIGAVQSLKASGVDMKDVVVVGVDATPDALTAMQAGDIDATVFQNATAQGHGALDTVRALAKGEPIPNKVYIPFELVTPANMADYIGKN